MRGWFRESYRHSLAARNIKTKADRMYYSGFWHLDKRRSMAAMSGFDYLKLEDKLLDRQDELKSVMSDPNVADADFFKAKQEFDDLTIRAKAIQEAVKGRMSLGAKQVFDPMRPVDTSAIPEGEFIAEKKYDGTRIMLSADKKGLKLINRRQVDKTKQFPELQDAKKSLKFKDSVKLDGEVVILKNGKDSFKELSSRNHLKAEDDIGRYAVLNPATFVAFDVLEKDSTIPQTSILMDRKKLLGRILPKDSKVIKRAPYSSDIKSVIKKARSQDAEGVVFKKKDSLYSPGTSSNWQKYKFKKENDYMVIGYTKGTGKRVGKVGALVLAHNGHGYKYAGDVGTGFTDAELNMVTNKVKALNVQRKPEGYPKVSSEAKVQFIKPKLVARVQYGRLGSQGRLKEPVFIALRTDITPGQTYG
jgi:DNA ligase D-like protein (predicted ligase)